jgi:hypothetical protein
VRLSRTRTCSIDAERIECEADSKSNACMCMCRGVQTHVVTYTLIDEVCVVTEALLGCMHIRKYISNAYIQAPCIREHERNIEAYMA